MQFQLEFQMQKGQKKIQVHNLSLKVVSKSRNFTNDPSYVKPVTTTVYDALPASNWILLEIDSKLRRHSSDETLLFTKDTEPTGKIENNSGQDFMKRKGRFHVLSS